MTDSEIDYIFINGDCWVLCDKVRSGDAKQIEHSNAMIFPCIRAVVKHVLQIKIVQNLNNGNLYAAYSIRELKCVHIIIHSHI